MKRMLLALALGGTAILAPATLSAEEQTTKSQQILALVKDIREQQVQITDNQAKIDEKLAALGESVRQARIFASRSGR